MRYLAVALLVAACGVTAEEGFVSEQDISATTPVSTTTTTTTTAAATTVPSTTTTTTTTAQVIALVVAEETDGGQKYNRKDYGSGWLKAVNDALGWRQEGCRWAFYSQLLEPDCLGNNHRDHLVALAEAHRSGAWEWPEFRKKVFYSEVSNLYVLPAGENIRKSDKDPASWLPERNECEYAQKWIDIKYDWNLTMDAQEQIALQKVLDNC